MKIVYFVFTIFLLGLLPVSETNDIIVKPGSIDKLFIGMDSLEVVKIYDSSQLNPVSYYNELWGAYESYIRINFGGGNSITADLNSSKIYRLRAEGDRFVTEKGIRWGQNFFDIKEKYTNYEVDQGEEMGPPFIILDTGIAFELDQTELWFERGYEKEQFHLFIDSSMTINSLIVFK
ncbi:MAG: hypothetical protein ABJ387_06650 [Balneola sp.]|jgi:hypothetical protein